MLFTNTEGHLLLEQNQQTILDKLQFDPVNQTDYQVELEISETKEHLTAFCMPTLWDVQQAYLAIIKSRQDFTGLLTPI